MYPQYHRKEMKMALLGAAILLCSKPTFFQSMMKEDISAREILAIEAKQQEQLEQAEWEYRLHKTSSVLYRCRPKEAAEITRAIYKYSALYNMDPEVVLALIRVESNGNVYALSNKGAIGLMQVMPATGAYVARSLGERWKGPDSLYDIDQNVKYGTYYLSDLYSQFDNYRYSALAAYFWGPATIESRILNRQTIPSEYTNKILRVLYEEVYATPEREELNTIHTRVAYLDTRIVN